MKLVTIVGARPQFIKVAVVSRALSEHNKSDGVKINELVVHTGQHYDYNMSGVFFEELGIPQPHYNLGIGSGSHGKMTGAMLEGIEDVLLKEKPDLVMVYGDTNSTLAGALAAVKLHIPVAHVEAGLRSFNRKMPEEINRVLTDHMASYIFCPTQTAVSNLEKEGIRKGVFDVGDVMYDAVLSYRKMAACPDRKGPFVLASLHRAENTDDPKRLRSILSAMNGFPIPVVLPLHPRTRKVLAKESIPLSPHVEIVDPLPYFCMLGHLEKCTFVMTDSGGLQKEAYFFGKKCITVRDETEWVELVKCGANCVVGADEGAICQEVAWALEPLSEILLQYGDGTAGRKIACCLVGESQPNGEPPSTSCQN